MHNLLYSAFLISALVCENVETILIDIRPFRQAILQSHNFYRRLEPAANMRYLTWDYGLQRRAALWSERCYFEHQRGYNLGENLSYFTSTGPAVPPRTVIQRSLSLWASEKRLWRFSRSCGQACHYTQMIWATTSRVGCSVSYCPVIRVGFGGIQRNAMYLVCKYYPAGNIIGFYPFIPGPRCSRCGYGARCFQGLCAGGYRGFRSIGFRWPGPLIGFRRRRFFGRRRRSVRLSKKEEFLQIVAEKAKKPFSPGK